MPSLLHTHAVDYFDALSAQQYAGFPTLALAETAAKFKLTRNELANLIRERREQERERAA